MRNTDRRNEKFNDKQRRKSNDSPVYSQRAPTLNNNNYNTVYYKILDIWVHCEVLVVLELW